jgi:hypothetical protein
MAGGRRIPDIHPSPLILKENKTKFTKRKEIYQLLKPLNLYFNIDLHGHKFIRKNILKWLNQM